MNKQTVITRDMEAACEIIRQEDARIAKNRKRKLLSVEIDPETYIAKEILYLEDMMHRMTRAIEQMEMRLDKLEEQIEQAQKCDIDQVSQKISQAVLLRREGIQNVETNAVQD